MIQNSKILITGGYGFIGAHLALRLAGPKLNNQITVFDLDSSPHTTGDDLKLLEMYNITISLGSVLEPKDFAKLPNDFDYIVHAAGFLGINKVADNQLITLDVNIIGTRNCLEFAAKGTIKPRVLVFSTSEIYGTECAEPDEISPSIIETTGKRWVYAASKLSAEYYLKAYIQQYGIKGSIIRPFNVFGPYRYGTNAMTTIVRKALDNEDIIISGDGTQIRSWCYIDDFCDGIVSILALADGDGEAYNIGDIRNQLSINDLAEKVVSLTNSDSSIVITGNCIEDVALRIPNIDKATSQLGYKPHAVFDESILKIADWLHDKDLEGSVL